MGKNEVLQVEITDTIKSFCLEIFSAFSFYARELNLMSKCRQMNKLYCEIIKIGGKDGRKKHYELKSPIRRKVYTESCIRRYSSNTVRFTKSKHFLSKS